ncbi:MAG: hypothetical protein ACOCXT_03100 [Candidatus Dojkabacteria bacterium]
MKEIKKHKNVAIVAGIVLIMIVMVSITIIRSNQSENEKWELPPEQKAWIEKYKNNEGYFIIKNSNYVMIDQPAFPEPLVELSNNNPYLSVLVENMQEQRVISDYTILLQELGMDFIERSLSVDAQVVEDKLFFVHLSESGKSNIKFLIGEGLQVKAVNLDPIALSYNTSDSERISQLIKELKRTLTTPQVQFVDSLYEDLKISFYFDKGLVFIGEEMLIFKPQSKIDEDFVKNIGLNYWRELAGCIYCTIDISNE